MKKIYAALVLLLPFISHAQHHYELLPFYESITAKAVVKKKADFNLKGNVRSVKETLIKIQHDDPKDGDTLLVTRYHFTEDGLLDSLSKGDTMRYGLSNSRARYEVYHYDAKSRRLKKLVIHDGSYYASVVTKTFNPEGFLASERFDARGMEDAELFSHTASYTYSKNHSILNIHYAYDQPTEQYDRQDDKHWVFTFDNAGRLVNESRREKSFSSGAAISYHPKWGLVTNINYMEHCATQNSCLILFKTIAYNDKGQKTSESLSDHTIRNSLWSYDYCYSYTYNDRNDVMKQAMCVANHGRLKILPTNNNANAMQLPVSEQPSTFFEYVYDIYGNWTEQKEYSMDGKDKKMLVSAVKREIGY